MEKCVLIIDEQLSVGEIANVSAVLSVSVGSKIKGLVGVDIQDKNGFLHQGLTQLPIPVLGTSNNRITEIIDTIKTDPLAGILVFDFNNYSKQARTYDEYISLIESASDEDIKYLGIALYGTKKQINRLTSGLKLINKL